MELIELLKSVELELAGISEVIDSWGICSPAKMIGKLRVHLKHENAMSGGSKLKELQMMMAVRHSAKECMAFLGLRQCDHSSYSRLSKRWQIVKISWRLWM